MGSSGIHSSQHNYQLDIGMLKKQKRKRKRSAREAGSVGQGEEEEEEEGHFRGQRLNIARARALRAKSSMHAPLGRGNITLSHPPAPQINGLQAALTVGEL